MTIQEMLRALAGLGLSQREIAEACNTSQPNIHRALNGAEPRYELGKAIEKFHKKTLRAMSRRAA